VKLDRLLLASTSCPQKFVKLIMKAVPLETTEQTGTD
jgi:hypothetical protein